MVNFTRLAATTKRLIEANGRTVELVRLNTNPDDTTKPWRGASSSPSEAKGGLRFSVKMSFVPPRGTGFGSMLGATEVGSQGVKYVRVGLMASDSVPNDRSLTDVLAATHIVDGERVLGIVLREELAPSDKSILFAFGVDG